MNGTDLNDAGQGTDDAENGATDAEKDAEKVANSNDQANGGEDLQKATGGSDATHDDNIGRLVTSLDGKSTVDGRLLVGIELGAERVWDETKNEFVETGKRIVAWLHNQEVVAADSIQEHK